MLEVQLQQVKRLMNVLDGADAKYKIILADGTEYGTLQVDKKRTKNRQHLYPYGTVRRQYKSYMQNLAVGKAEIIPAGNIDVSVMASSISAFANTTWGAGSVATKVMRDINKVQVVRIY